MAALFTQGCYTVQKGFLRCNRPVAVLLQDYIIPGFIFQRCQCLSPHLRFRVKLFCEVGAAAGVSCHVRTGKICQHGRHIIIVGKTVAKH